MRTIIPENPKIGICLATHAAVPYIDTGLACLRRHEPQIKVLVHDDFSNDRLKLNLLCDKYGADFFTTEYRKVETVGDLSSFAEALRWGQENNLDIVVKCSRRFIADRPWSSELANLMHSTQYVTATGHTPEFGFGFRSEWVAMHVPTWVGCGAYAAMAETARQNQYYDPLPEAWYHHRARQAHAFAHPQDEPTCHQNNSNHPDCDFLVMSESRFARPATCDAYIWFASLLGLARKQIVPNVYWHDSRTPFDYFQLAKKYDLCYEPAEFMITPGE
jgi:hypothetical protein